MPPCSKRDGFDWNRRILATMSKKTSRYHRKLTEADRVIAEALTGFLPKKIFDIHAHLYRTADFKAVSALPADGPQQVAAVEWRKRMALQTKGAKLVGGLFMPYPASGVDVEQANAYLLEQLDGAKESRGLVMAAFNRGPDSVAACLDHPRMAGFKPYHVFSSKKNTYEAKLSEYVPEWAWRLADKRGWVMTIHLVRHGALADEANRRELVALCQKYPGVKIVLAHGARGFHAPNTIGGIKRLAHLENLWFDTSAVCESSVFTAILQEFGPRRLLWGSDFPVAQERGRCVTVGDGFFWISPAQMDQRKGAPAFRPALIGLESLRALQQAAMEFGLEREDLDDIFLGNALRLLGMTQATATLDKDLYAHARQRIPGGVQLLSKRPEMLAPGQWPAYFREARGCEVWDLDGRHYYDMSSNGISACLLGFRDPEVTRAVMRRVNLGSMCTLNPPEEVELADRLCRIHPWAERVRFGRSGGEIGAVAVRIARATTGRSVVAICGYHGWHDWYLAANLGADDTLRGHLLPGLEPSGVPSELRGTTAAFTYNNRKEFQAILDQHGPRLAAVIMEPCRYFDPEPGFLEFVRDGAHRAGALLIFDEITIGWRLHHGGAHMKFGVAPDMAIFAKALGNGHPMAAVIGTQSAMEGAEKSFISSTYWTESVGPVAALAVLDRFERVNVPAYVNGVGAQVKGFWKKHALAHKLPVEVDAGYPCLAHFKFAHEASDALRTLYTQGMLARGFLAGVAISPTLAHNATVLNKYDRAIDEVFADIAAALKQGDVLSRLRGAVAHSGFRRLL